MHDEDLTHTLYITSRIKEFQKIDDLGGYIRTASRVRRAIEDSEGRKHRFKNVLWPDSWPRIDRLTLFLTVTTVIGLIVAILAFLVDVHLLKL